MPVISDCTFWTAFVETTPGQTGSVSPGVDLGQLELDIFLRQQRAVALTARWVNRPYTGLSWLDGIGIAARIARWTIPI